jgi:hypothetical protein
MSFADDAPDLALRRKPARGGLFTPIVWMSLGSAGTCIILAIAFMAFAPHILPGARTAAPERPAQPPLQTQSQPQPPAQVPAPPSQPVAAQPVAAQPSQPSAAQPASLVAAAELALALDSVSEASETGRPFARQMTLIDTLAPGSRGAALLRPLAERGVPTLAVLAAEFPETARRTAYASRAPAKASGFWARLSYAFNVVFTVRRTDRTAGDAPDAILARAEHLLYDGDLEGALKAMDALPAKGKDASAAWRERASRRIQLQNGLEALRGEAVARLDAARRGAAQ